MSHGKKQIIYRFKQKCLYEKFSRIKIIAIQLSSLTQKLIAYK